MWVNTVDFHSQYEFLKLCFMVETKIITLAYVVLSVCAHMCAKLLQSCPTLFNPRDCSLQSSSMYVEVNNKNNYIMNGGG